MDIAKLILDYLRALAWFLLVLGMVIYARRELRGAVAKMVDRISHVSRVKVYGIEAYMANSVEVPGEVPAALPGYEYIDTIGLQEWMTFFAAKWPQLAIHLPMTLGGLAASAAEIRRNAATLRKAVEDLEAFGRPNSENVLVNQLAFRYPWRSDVGRV